jgi:hypothetical protein
VVTNIFTAVASSSGGSKKSVWVGKTPDAVRKRAAAGKQKAEDREVLQAHTRAQIARVRAEQTVLALRLEGLERLAASFEDEE